MNTSWFVSIFKSIKISVGKHDVLGYLRGIGYTIKEEDISGVEIKFKRRGERRTDVIDLDDIEFIICTKTEDEG